MQTVYQYAFTFNSKTGGMWIKQPLSPKQLQQRRNAAMAAKAKVSRETRSANGRKGLAKVLEIYPDFHARGGEATARIDAYTSPSGAVGLGAWVNDGLPLKGKKHRYLGDCKRCHHSSKKQRWAN